MSMELWGLSGGSPRWVSGNVTVGVGNQDTTIVTVAAGKRIIPVWFFLWGIGSATTVSTFTLRGANVLDANRSTCVLDNVKSYVEYMQPLFFKFGVMERNNFGSGDNLKLTTSSSDGNTTGDVYKYTLGYYLVDA